MDPMSFEPLTPTAFLERSSIVFGDRLAVVDGDRRFSYRELAERVHCLAGALVGLGVGPGDRVAVLAPNSVALLEAHYGVPLAGAVLVALNVRLLPSELAAIIEHSGSRTLVFDASLAQAAEKVRDLVPGLVVVQAGGPPDRAGSHPSADVLGYEALLAAASPVAVAVEDERSPLSINYTSGTTGAPKGVVYHHRGAYLQALAMAYHMVLDPGSVFLWTLPMFHCNGWCFTWAVTAAGGTHVCLSRVDPEVVWRLVREEGVTHLNAAPTVLATLAEHPAAAPPPRLLRVATGGAPPWPALLSRLAAFGMEVTHLYGLTETYGPVAICQWRPEWNELSPSDQAARKARQGVANVISRPLRVLDGTGQDVLADGQSVGEIAIRGNNVMLGYYENAAGTLAAAPDGWFRTGDLGVVHPDGYVEITDRAKDIIVSGGENIASVEVEQVLASHPAVLEAAVVAWPDQRWGEVPGAFVTLREGGAVTDVELLAYAREHLAHFKAPKHVVFGPLPRTSTGKVEKFRLREQARSGGTREGD